MHTPNDRSALLQRRGTTREENSSDPHDDKPDRRRSVRGKYLATHERSGRHESAHCPFDADLKAVAASLKDFPVEKDKATTKIAAIDKQALSRGEPHRIPPSSPRSDIYRRHFLPAPVKIDHIANFCRGFPELSTYFTIDHSTYVGGEFISILLAEKLRWSSTFVLSLALALTRSLTLLLIRSAER
jgi:hypothetical protein